MKLKLTAEQAEDLPFPIGCPVWYNFPEIPSDGIGKERVDPPVLKRGVVESVSFKYGKNEDENDVIYDVVYEDEDGRIVEEVSEKKLAYGANCPVTVEGESAEGQSEGTVLLCEPSFSNPSAIMYTVMIPMEGFRARYESEIDGSRIKYRKVTTEPSGEKVASNDVPADVPADAGANVEKDQSPDTKNVTNKPAASAMEAQPDKETVPSSITLDSVAKSNDKDSNVGARSNQQSKVADEASPSSKKMRVDTTHGGSHGNDNVGGSMSRGSRGYETPIIELKTPSWLQTDAEYQRDLFFHLIGHKDNRGRKRTVRDIDRETGCHTRVNLDNASPKYRGHSRAAPPISITIKPHDRSSHLHEAIESVLELLLDYLTVIGDDNAKGRLLYEVSSSCPGPHRPRGSSSRAVESRNDPFNRWGRFMSIVELPHEYIDGRRHFHARYLLHHRILKQIKDQRCLVKICGDDFGRPLKSCDPYVYISGVSWEGVDRATDIVKEERKRHMDECACDFRRC